MRLSSPVLIGLSFVVNAVSIPGNDTVPTPRFPLNGTVLRRCDCSSRNSTSAQPITNTTDSQNVTISVNATHAHPHKVIILPLHDNSTNSTGTTSIPFNASLAIPIREPCSHLVAGSAPKPPNDTPEDFVNFFRYKALALDAKTPTGYIRTFQNQKAAVSLPTFISSKQLATYDPAACARDCNALSSCSGFNIFVQREPSLNPGPSCSDPSSTSSFRCALFGSFTEQSAATDQGRTVEGFQVMIAASNAYNRQQILPDRIDGYQSADALPGAFNLSKATVTQLIRGPFEPAQCAIACNQARMNITQAHGVINTKPGDNSTVLPHGQCGYFNAFLAVYDTRPVGTFCALFKSVQPFKEAKEKVVDFKGRKYEVAYSYAYGLGR